MADLINESALDNYLNNEDSFKAVKRVGDTMTGQLNLSGTDHFGLRLVRLTTAQRDALSAVQGAMIFNTTTSAVEVYDGSSWLDATAGAAGGEANSATTVGSGTLMVAGKSGTTIQIKSLGAGTGISLASASNSASISVDQSALSLTSIGGTLTIAKGGTSGATAASARSNLGLAIGSDVQAYDAVLADLAGLSLTKGDIVVYDGSNLTKLDQGTGGDYLQVHSAAATGLRWNSAAGGSGSGETNTASNLGSGLGIFKDKSGVDLRFRSIGADSTITLTSAANSVSWAVNQSNLSLTSIGGTLTIAKGGTSGATAASARTNLGLEIGADVQAWDADLDTLAGLTKTDGLFIVGATSAWETQSAATARTSLGLGSIATQNSNAVTITGGTISGITDLKIADGGTSASTAASARTNLGLAIGSDVQAWDADLDTLAGLTKTDNFFIVGATSAWESLSAGGARTAMGLGTIATQNSNAVSITGGVISAITDLKIADGGTSASTAASARTNLGLAIGTDVQAYDADLSAIAGLTGTKGDVLVHNGTSWTDLAVGTNDHVLTADSTQAAGVKWAAAAGGGGGAQKTFIASQTLTSAAASITFSSGLTGYDRITVYINNIQPVSNATGLRMQFSTDGGSTYESGATDYAYSLHVHWTSHTVNASNGTTGYRCFYNQGNAANEKCCGHIEIWDMDTSAQWTAIQSEFTMRDGSTNINGFNGAGHSRFASAVDGIKFYYESGNIASGATISVWGETLHSAP